MVVGVPGLSGGGIPAADKLAAAAAFQVMPFMTGTPKAENSACPWHLIGLSDDVADQRAAVAWIVADAIMKERCGHTRVYGMWRDAAIGGIKLLGDDAELAKPCIRPVFGLPPAGSAAQDHVPGYVGEWLWYLLTREETIPGRQLELLDPPSWGVTEGGGDGFVVHRVPSGADTTLIFRLWEIKKFTGTGPVSATITTAATQLASRSEEYLAKISWANRKLPGDLGRLMSELTELWMRADQRAGAGVSVSTNTATAPVRAAFTQVPTYLPRLVHPGQLRGLIIAVNDFTAFAEQVRGYVWSAL